MVEKSDFSATAPNWLSQIYGPMQRFGERVAEFFAPNSEAAAAADYYEISVELPGVPHENVSVDVHDGRLTVSGEKQEKKSEEGKSYFFSEITYGRFQRVFRLPPDADEDKISATHKDGVLTIKIAKAQPETSTAKSIPINRG